MHLRAAERATLCSSHNPDPRTPARDRTQCDLPYFLRYSRSISTRRTRDTTAGVPSSRSMRSVKTEVKCLQLTEVRCPLFTGYRVQSSRMKRLWECGHLAVRDVQGPQDRHFHSAVGCSC